MGVQIINYPCKQLILNYYKMAIAQVLSIASIILGIYIIGVFLFTQEEQIKHRIPLKSPQFHIGCFLTSHNLSHSTLMEKFIIDALKRKQPITYDSNKYLSNDLHADKAVEVAKIFDIFVREYSFKKDEMKSYTQLSKATKKAYQQYQYCAQLIKNGETFEQNQCRGQWIQFQNCSTKLNLIKQQLSILLDRKSQIIYKTQEMIFKMSMDQKQVKNQTKQYQKQYYAKEKELELQEKGIEAHIKIIQQKISSVQYSLLMAQNQTEHSEFLYKQCALNRKEFQLCEDISEEVRSLGHVTLENLWAKVQRKRNSLIKIESMINNQQQSYERIKYEEIKNKSLEQYKKLHRIFIQTKAKMDKNCGCTQLQEQTLYKNLQTSIKNIQNLKQKLAALEEKFQQETKSLNLIRQKKSLLLRDFQLKIKSEKKNPIQEFSYFGKLEKIILEKEELNKKILLYEQKLRELSQNCDGYKQELTGYMGKISAISDCRLKKDYYLTLEQSLRKERKRLNFKFENKNKLIEALKDFRI